MKPPFNPAYEVTLYERARTHRRFSAYLGTSPPTPQDGGGGYQVITLPQRGAVTVWQGRPAPVTLTLPLRLYLDQVTAYAPKQTATVLSRPEPKHRPSLPAEPFASPMGRLFAMWRPSAVNATIPPPVLKMKASRDLVPYSQLSFVLSDFQWGSATADDKGHRYIQDLTLVLLEYRHDEELQPVSASSSQASQTVYRVRQGDSLQSIARRFHVPGGWATLGKAQHPPITDPRGLKVGARLSIPQADARSGAASG